MSNTHSECPVQLIDGHTYKTREGKTITVNSIYGTRILRGTNGLMYDNCTKYGNRVISSTMDSPEDIVEGPLAKSLP